MEDHLRVELDRGEHREAVRRSAPSTLIVYEAIRREGEHELQRPNAALAWSGLAAGLSMGFSFVAEALLHAHLPETPWRPLISKFGYSIGFLIVILGRQQLFTENTLTPILELLVRKKTSTLVHVLRLWAVVLLANMIGAYAFAWVISNTSIFEADIRRVFASLGHEGLTAPFWTVLLRAVFAGWLIALMVWLLPFAETGRVAVIVLITYVIGLGGFAHIIAGSVETLAAVVVGAASWGTFLGKFFVPTLLGNIIGGMALVAAVSYAQIASEKQLT